MTTDQYVWQATGYLDTIKDQITDKTTSQLVMAFGARDIFEKDDSWLTFIRNKYPNAELLINTTAGEIANHQVHNNTVSITAINFNKAYINVVSKNIDDTKDAYKIGKEIANNLRSKELKHIFLICDGLNISGDNLIKAMNENLPGGIKVTGGFAGDGERFEKTLVGLNSFPIENNITAIGFYGNSLTVKYGVHKGWSAFGPKRLITKANGNKLFELDGENALELYKKYLGDKTSELPGSAFLFPLGVHTKDQPEPTIRTILAIDEEEQSMTFAAGLIEGDSVQLMKANLNELIHGSYDKALEVHNGNESIPPDLTIIVSCVGRKVVLGERIDDEVENVRDAMGTNSVLTGFYSYGEFAPLNDSVECCLHNQTMTMTTFFEQD